MNHLIKKIDRQRFVLKILKMALGKNLFSSMMCKLDKTIFESHQYDVLKKIIEQYTTIRQCHYILLLLAKKKYGKQK